MQSAFPPEKDFYSIGEASRLTGVRPYILRYWEKEFSLLRPVRRASGHRKFTRKDLEAVRRLRELLYDRKFTVEGAKKFLRKEGRTGAAQVPMELSEASSAVQLLREVRAELAEMADSLRRGSSEAD